MAATSAQQRCLSRFSPNIASKVPLGERIPVLDLTKSNAARFRSGLMFFFYPWYTYFPY